MLKLLRRKRIYASVKSKIAYHIWQAILDNLLLDDIIKQKINIWWRRRGSNSRPYGCEPYALPSGPQSGPFYEHTVLL